MEKYTQIALCSHHDCFADHKFLELKDIFCYLFIYLSIISELFCFSYSFIYY